MLRYKIFGVDCKLNVSLGWSRAPSLLRKRKRVVESNVSNEAVLDTKDLRAIRSLLDTM